MVGQSVPSDLENLGFSLFGNREANLAVVEAKDNFIRELLSIRTAVGTYRDPRGIRDNPLVVPLLLDFFDSPNIDELGKLDRRIYFEYTLFAALKLPDAIKEIPDFSEDLKEFFDYALMYFENRMTTGIEQSSSAPALAFLYTQWQRVLVYMEKQGVKEVDGIPLRDYLENVRKDIRKWQQDPRMENRDVQQQFLLVLIDSYGVDTFVPERDAGAIVGTLVAYNQSVEASGASKQLHPAFVNSALSVPIKKQAEIQKAFADNPMLTSRVLCEAAKVYGFSVPEKAVWMETEFPIYAYQDGQHLLEVNILTGNLFVDKKVPLPESKAVITREIEGHLYTYHPEIQHKMHALMPPFVGINDLGVWLSQDTPPHCLFVDTTTNKPILRLESSGCFTFEEDIPKVEWEWVDPQDFSGNKNLTSLDAAAIILQARTGNVPKMLRLQLPNLVDDTGQTLEFERRPVKGYADPQWVMKHKPHLIVASNQRFPGLKNFSNYLVLENASVSKKGKQKVREVLIPLKSKEELDTNVTVSTSCVAAAITNTGKEAVAPRGIVASAHLCYLTLINARTPEDYARAMDFLQGARKFERYDPEELKQLGWIFASQKKTQDSTVHADAVRLFAAWLVHDNFKRHPQKPKESDTRAKVQLSFNSAAADWERFWEGQFPGEDLNMQLKTVAQHYFARQHHLPQRMRLNNPENLSEQELRDWDLEKYAAPVVPPPYNQSAEQLKVTAEDIDRLLNMSEKAPMTKILIHSRPQDSLHENFIALLRDAQSTDPEVRESAEKSYMAMRFDQDTKVFSTILRAALLANSNKDAKAVMDYVDGIRKKGLRWECQKQAKELQNLLVLIPGPSDKRSPGKVIVPPVTIFPPLQKLSSLPGAALNFTPSQVSDIPQFEQLANKVFIVDASVNTVVAEPFTFDTEDEWLQESLEELNKDYIAGVEKNKEIPKYQLVPGVSVENLLQTVRSEAEAQLALYAEDLLKERESNIVAIANSFPIDQSTPEERVAALNFRADRLSGKTKTLGIRDCVGLFLQGNIEGYRHATGLRKSEDIEKLHNQIGDYIIFHNKANRCKEVLKAIKTLKDAHDPGPDDPPRDQANVDAALQKVASELQIKSLVDPTQDPRALMAFEYELNMTLKGHQVEGIRDMLKIITQASPSCRGVLLQRIQGGGKSLVFGHIMALLKADGEHLSVHIPATPQYQTSIYDMSARSQHLFGQRERTLVFDDDPQKFTPEYLQWVKGMLVETIVNREYISITNESLRAMRCKYLKTRFEIKVASPDVNVEALERSNQILKEILSLFRTKGIFTFDEMHLAIDPKKELNMPYGDPKGPELDESQILSKIVSLAYLATDANGPLLDCKHSPQQTDMQYAEMCKQIVDGLVEQPGWEDESIKSYLLGKTPNLPQSLGGPDNKLAKLVILARQMVAGNWLRERLNTYVNEHHGLPDEEFPRVSIPFLANTKPSIGSEFSDRYVMTTNTLIAYLATGLNEVQTKELVELHRKKAIQQQLKMEEDAPCRITDTQACKDFEEATGIKLFEIDLNKEADIQNVQKAFKSDRLNAKAVEMLLGYIVEKEISHVEIYDNQVCSNGQNVASMCQLFVAYSASMENKNMAPVGSTPIPEKGTNGQTIDLLIRRETKVHLVDDDMASLFSAMKNNPERDKIHANIDVGAYFRGMRNESVAKVICDYLVTTKSTIQGVLFLSTKSGSLCFMQRDYPNTVKQLSMTTPEAIESETGFKKSELFTYYDQEHMTGVDISQDEKAIGDVTMSKHTKIHEILQGARRLRELDLQQKNEVYLTKGTLKAVEATLKKNYGQKAPPIKDLLLYANITEATGQKSENMLYCLQKMEDVVQQYVLDKLYRITNVDEERDLFSKAAYLFEKSVAVDLYREYANARRNEKMPSYLNTIKETLIQPLEGVLTNEEIKYLRTIIDEEVLKKDVLKGIDKEIEVAHGFSPEKMQIPLANRNSETSRVQARKQERVSEKLMVTTIETRQVRGKKESNPRVSETKFSREQFFDTKFGTPQDVNIEANEPCCWSLNGALATQKPELREQWIFDEGLIVTNDAAMSRAKKVDLLGDYRKKPWPLTIICDETGEEKSWKVVLGSIQDTRSFWDYLRKDPKIPPGRSMRLARGNGKRLAGLTKLDIDADPKLSLLMTQAMFLSGDYRKLGNKTWLPRVKAWLDPLPIEQRQIWVRLFEEEILAELPLSYLSSSLYSYLHTNKVK